ncbi:UNVERIFIED_CONTAM: Serine carboxypeptidase-like 31 [Sesamum calycinum]|uniref:Serine carboxypeptidase-like 31 n=1 Tax=Sesamum calycinum TaxID=2727403 RepID=A0AAW2Q6C7_9LAMI
MGLVNVLFVLSLLMVSMEPLVTARYSHWSNEKKSDFEAAEDLVTSLPGQPSVSFRHYAGHVTVNEKNGRALFYWFYEATTLADQKPLVLWLNGGPGCSSVGYGATQEIGPFLVDLDGGGLTFNSFSWNTEANLLFLESPIGVGFSYTNTSSDYDGLGDDLTANDACFPAQVVPQVSIISDPDILYCGRKLCSMFQSWLKLFTIRTKIPSLFIDLRGILLGNPETHDAEDWRGIVDYAWSHAIVSDETHKTIIRTCDFYSDDPWNNTDCKTAVQEMFKQYKEIDMYSLYTTLCQSNSSASADMSTLFTGRSSSNMMPRLMGGYDPCLDHYANTYYNRLDVQKALHVADGTSLRNWTICNMTIFYRWSDSRTSVLPIYKKLIAAGLRIWVYSGDTDGRVPVLSTRYSLSSLGLPIKKAWRPWYHQKQVGGWIQEYYGLTFATFRGAGHDVPTFKPSESLAFFASFLAGESLPSERD